MLRPAYLHHVFIKQQQNLTFKRMRQALNTSNTAVLQVDFSENFTADMQDEVQSAHWNKKQFTIFTAFLWLGTDTLQSYAIISDNLQHDKYVVCAHLSKILNKMHICG